MANEVTLTAQLEFAKGGADVKMPEGSDPLSILRDVAGSFFIRSRQSVGTTWESLEVGEVATRGYILMINRDATNFAQVRATAASAALIRLSPGDICLFRFDAAATDPQVQADTATVELEYLLVAA